ncbi:MAG TPA: glycosyltransferase [Casimicrobiaceae bacterium]
MVASVPDPAAAKATPPAEAPPGIVCSVLIGRVSRREAARILDTLGALRAQSPALAREVIVADRLNDAVSRQIERDFPEVRLLAFPPETSLPALRTAALLAARGRYAVVTEDHCVPAPDWLARIVSAFAHEGSDVVAVGGTVVNGLAQRWLDRATFQCEYGGYLPPRPSGPDTDLPGMNVAYLRERLVALDRAALVAGFWETTVHRLLLQQGARLAFANDARVAHCKHLGLLEFLGQRFLYSRYYAGNRFERSAWTKRIAALLASPLLPLIVLWRFQRGALRRRRYWEEFASLAPLLALFALVWTAGEMAGYAFGPGDALARLE